MQSLVRRVPLSRSLIRAAVTLARMTRPGDADAPSFIKEYVEWGAGPRASQYLVLGAKARAAMAGRPMADLEDVRSVAPSEYPTREATSSTLAPSVLRRCTARSTLRLWKYESGDFPRTLCMRRASVLLLVPTARAAWSSENPSVNRARAQVSNR